MGTRRKSRELALQMLFQADMGRQSFEQVCDTFWRERADNVTDDARRFAEDLFRAATDRTDEIDKIIVQHAEHWRMDRMSAVDRNILRAGVAEFLAWPGTPRPIVINEFLEVARKFSGPESVQFINGVLDSVAKALPQAEVKARPRRRARG
jgi:N utilization substance protein B